MSSGIERIAAAFAAARDEGRAALMPYMMGGFPDLESSREVLAAYIEGGADLIELGVPYSDPLADGPVIHAAATEALRAGARLDDVLGLCAEATSERGESCPPILPMVYANMALCRGAEGFAEALADAGASGAIVPDLPPEADPSVGAALAERGLALVPFVTPTSSQARIAALAADSEATGGFVYVVSLTGVTGERSAAPDDLRELIGRVREAIDLPAAVGFGISSPEAAAEVGSVADGVIIGSRLVREVEESGPGAAREFVAATLERLRD